MPRIFTPLVRWGIYALLDDAMLASFGFPRPFALARKLVSGALITRGWVVGILPARKTPNFFTDRKTGATRLAMRLQTRSAGPGSTLLTVMTIIPATNAHSEDIWEIFREVVASGDTYGLDPQISREDALRYWLSEAHHAFVVTDNDPVYGTYILKKNHPGWVLTSQMPVTWFLPRLVARGSALSMREHSRTSQAARFFRHAIQHRRQHQRSRDRPLEKAWL